MVVRWSTGLVQVHLVAGPVSPQAHPVIFPPSAGMCNWNRHIQQWARCLTRTLVTMPSWLRRAWPQGPELGPLLPASAHLLGGVYFPIDMLRAPTFPAPDSYSCLFNIALGCLTGERIQNQTPATPARALPRPAPGSAQLLHSQTHPGLSFPLAHIQPLGKPSPRLQERTLSPPPWLTLVHMDFPNRLASCFPS